MRRLIAEAREVLRNPLGVALALALVFGAWEIVFADFMADDLMQIGVLEGLSPAAAWTGPLNLYTISDGDPAHVQVLKDAGLMPWFFDPAFEMRFFRPLSSMLLVLDHRVFGLHPTGYRLHGVLWSLALVAAAAVVLRRALAGRTATIAIFVFAVSAIHGSFCWTAARHVVIAAALGFAALAAHMRWREDGWKPGVWLSLLALVLSLAASEVGVAVAFYLLAYEGLGVSDTMRSRLRALVPALVVLVVYLLLWGEFGHGASAGSDYLDPFRSTGQFLRELPGRLAVLCGGVVLGGGADLWVVRPDLRPVMQIAGTLVTLGFVALLGAAWREASAAERRALRWLGVAALGSAVPFTGTPIGGRCLIVPFVGGAACLAIVIHRWWTVWRQRSGLGHRVLGAGCASLALIHFGIAPLGRIASPVLLHHILVDRVAAAIPNAELDQTTLPAQNVVVLVAPDFMIGMEAGFSRLFRHLPMPATWRVLSWARAPHRFVRTASDTLEMEIAGGGITSPTLRPGTVITVRGMEATVLAVGARGPSRVRLRFGQPLDDSSLVFLAWHNERLRRVTLPPIGGIIELAP